MPNIGANYEAKRNAKSSKDAVAIFPQWEARYLRSYGFPVPVSRFLVYGKPEFVAYLIEA